MSHALDAYLAGSAALVARPEIDAEGEEVVMERAAKTLGHRIEGGVQAAARFALAGNARFTIVSKKTGERFTFRVRAKKDERAESPSVYFVSVLTGPDNTSSYDFLGTVFATERVQIGGGSFGPMYGRRPASEPKFVHGKKSKIGESAPSAKAFAWWWGRVSRGAETPECEIWHLGKCGRCGRDLTVPESIACGLGPECASKKEGA